MPLDLKSTINLPKTAFPMKANLPQNEPKILARWEDMRLYDRIRELKAGAPAYVLHDGPPYANGPIHLGHALNKCLKDFVVKSKNMAGFDAPYIPGWDCHGLPIEIKVDHQLGGKKLQMKPLDVRLECRKYAQKYLDLQRVQFKRIGVLGRFDKPYSTMTPEYESVVLATFYKFFEDGFVYKGLRPVYWCMHDRTALAEAEVEYETHTSPTVFVRYRMQSDPRTIEIPRPSGAWTGHPPETNPLADVRITKNKPVYTIIWTTTPWTLPASMAVAFHPSEEYVALEAQDAIYIVAEKLAKSVAEKCGFPDATAIAHFPGKAMEHTWFYHPFLPWERRKILGVVADYLTMDTGTGVVHTAPSHGAEDFATGVRYQLDPTCDVDAAGIIHNGLPEYDGLKVLKANEPIIELLKTRGALLHSEKVEHQYPHCWRCHNPVIFRATEQWFISMETKSPPKQSLHGAPTAEMSFRTRALEEIKQVKWDPAWGEERISNMVETRPDWCISRQRVWGVPIAVFACNGCGKPLNDPAVNRRVVEVFAKSGADSWYTGATDALAVGAQCAGCGGTVFAKENDILDVWFESGCSYLVETASEQNYPWPSDLYLEGGDQYRGWFMSSLLCSLGAHGSAPYKGVVTPGWTLDEQGRAMSKSRGTDVDPVDIANRLGGEIVRLWVASVDFREDVVGSENLMQRTAETYRDIRNKLFRYVLSNLYDFDPARHAVPFEKLQAVDQYILQQACALSADVIRWYEEFAFHKIYQRVNHFVIVELSAFYVDVIKDRLYTFAPDSPGRRAAQTALWRIGEALVRLLAPIMSFTCDEVWQNLPKIETRGASVHMAKFPTAEDILGSASVPKEDPQQKSDWTTLLSIRDQVLKPLEEARAQNQIGKSLEARVKLTASDPLYGVLERHKDDLRYVFIVSQVTLEKGSGNGTGSLQVEVSRADGEKCERCWNYSTHVGEDPKYPTVCERCAPVLRQLEAGNDPETSNN
ncbi:MAG: isoleucine--tRNA ligase [Acidobacteria bacterium]|nr:MAG: isoleucine--tRNA ligase [Acidobacteriota bacterium]